MIRVSGVVHRDAPPQVVVRAPLLHTWCPFLGVLGDSKNRIGVKNILKLIWACWGDCWVHPSAEALLLP